MPSSACHSAPRPLPPFPTRRSSDLPPEADSPPTALAGLRALARERLGPEPDKAGPAATRTMAAIVRDLKGMPEILVTREHTHRIKLRSEEHTSELQSHVNLVCRLLLATPPPDLSPLSLHDALPICRPRPTHRRRRSRACARSRGSASAPSPTRPAPPPRARWPRSCAT